MNRPTKINSELLSAEARGRKHIPFAVFAVILVHVILFLVLLIAAGCRAKARAKRNLQRAPEMVQQGLQPGEDNSIAADQLNSPDTDPDSVIATEPAPAVEAIPAPRNAVERTTTPRPPASTVRASVTYRTYIVQPGDTFEKIARRHGTTVKAIKNANNITSDLIHPGQKLRVGGSKSQTSKEV